MTQQAALSIMKCGYNIFLTGQPGAGKTHVLNQYIDYLRNHGVEVAITAPTGIAASHLDGMTIHSFFGLGIKDNLSDADISELMEREYLVDRIKNLKVLVIDEVSMLSPNIFLSIDALLCAFKYTEKPFGGVQVIFTGDFFQLPPINTTSEERFIFQTERWNTMDLKTCYLEGSHRHKDKILLNILNEIRQAKVSEQSMEHFRSRYKKPILDNNVTKLYTYNRDVDSINFKALEILPGNIHHYAANTTGQKKWVQRVFSTSLVLEELTLKKGALVFFIKNNYAAGYINGTLGNIVDFDNFDNPIVETLDGKRICAQRVTWTTTDSQGEVRAEIKQIPLRLAWAITIHKSQGMTLDAAEIDLSSAFEPGQGYVALSRIKSLDGLSLMGLNDTALCIDSKVLEVDVDMKSHSNEIFEVHGQISDDDIEDTHKKFITSIGGTEKPNLAKKVVKKKGVKIDTIIETKKLLEDSLSIDEIANKRGLKNETIYTHIYKIHQSDPDFDISYMRPDKKVIQNIEKKLKKIKKDNNDDNFSENGSVRLKAIYDACKEEYSYEDIKIALLFIED